jgi:hypothetical protein
MVVHIIPEDQGLTNAEGFFDFLDLLTPRGKLCYVQQVHIVSFGVLSDQLS